MLRQAERDVVVVFRVEMHLGDDEACTVNKIFHVNTASLGKCPDRLIAMGDLNEAVKARDRLAVQAVRFIPLIRERDYFVCFLELLVCVAVWGFRIIPSIHAVPSILLSSF